MLLKALKKKCIGFDLESPLLGICPVEIIGQGSVNMCGKMLPSVLFMSGNLQS